LKALHRWIIWLVGLPGSVAAYTNETMTPEFKKVIYDDPIHGILDAYVGQLGSWFYLMLALVPFFGMYMYHGQRLTIASIWLICCLSAYRYLLTGVPDHVFYLVAVAWVFSVIMRVASPVYRD